MTLRLGYGNTRSKMIHGPLYKHGETHNEKNTKDGSENCKQRSCLVTWKNGSKITAGQRSVDMGFGNSVFDYKIY